MGRGRNQRRQIHLSGGLMETASRADLLRYLPQQRPFRFVDELLEVDEQRILSKYTLRNEEFFYPGHYPGDPVTPGAILLEAMAQGGVALHSIYLLSREMDLHEARQYRLLLTDVQMEIRRPVVPKEVIWIRGEVELWRLKRIRSRCELLNDSQQLVASAVIAGKGVRIG